MLVQDRLVKSIQALVYIIQKLLHLLVLSWILQSSLTISIAAFASWKRHSQGGAVSALDDGTSRILIDS